ncbi:hypothetical protein ADJ77_09585 [Prevotella fusca JCM 17724]|uniref:Uncharacterized protein n=1 Tax=Prevotella fusca JCM 17724 TaxID=1236517 RepID=A0A0K1NLV9_9BACT|nr:hypothetical protein ADJ77_09585 [Prevotella fusca JCM 17724]
MNDSSVKCVDWKKNKGLYTLYGIVIQNQMVSQKGIKHRIKGRKVKQIPCLSVFYKQIIPIPTNVCKLFSYSSKPTHGL